MVVAAAVEGEADHIMSGDAHLLKLDESLGIKIINLREFGELLGQ